MPPFTPIEDRVARRTRVAETGCLEWTGSTDKDGYGTVMYRNQFRRVHRLVWEAAHGPIPSGMMVLHRCDNPPCCELSHLFIGTAKDNLDDMIAKGRDDFGYNARKTHCPKGHPLTGENLRVEPNGWRVCRTCKGWKGLS